MSKRGPGSELNDRNWDDEEEPEEAGFFTQASQEAMQQRVIKKAKRRGVGEEHTASTPFGGFAGLSKLSQAKNDSSKSLGTGSLFGVKPVSFGGASSFNGAEDQQKGKVASGKESSSYLPSLKSLNESVLAWIKQHVEDNPYIILTPIFKDYEKHLGTIEAKRSSSSASCASPKKDSIKSDEGASSAPQPTPSSLSKDMSKATDGEEKSSSKPEETNSKPFTFGISSSEPQPKGFTFGSAAGSSLNGGFKFNTTSSMPGFSFSSKTDSSSSNNAEDKPRLSFGLSAPSTGSGFSFGAAAAAAAGSSKGESSQGSQESKDDEEYVPPKPEVKEIKEDDALYSKRCKLYYQKDNQWIDRGVGNLHLKPVEETKTQLLIRADTNLGNILLNVILATSMPFSRQGKNNVFFVCVPNPPISSKPGTESEETPVPVPMLIRVKTGEDADELLGKLEERKQLL
ncbi:nuclear pore complex protein Nup50 [Aplysia californica]|uniref:Nuclear pore complex protein Nup50 n=1 Tax=Aplysia californica TaxID=6500 RepID=A0ABM0K458_APLCA|nr:nuclear pore complex protein Nup50 [Aplysia californica]XP_035828279.1 nuclear pore complex protein Nup50 [Aplysia californica]